MFSALRIGRLTVLLLIALAVRPAAGQLEDAAALALAVKATYLYKFQPFVTWPDQAFAKPDSPFNLCIVGGDPFGALIDRAVAGQSAGSHPFAVLRLTGDGVDHCQIFYLAPGSPRTGAPANGAILTVTDGETEAARKGIVNFLIANNRVRFEIDNEAAAQAGLAISSKLLSLAVSVKSGR